MKVHGAYWSPPKRCGNYAVTGGYCWLHQTADELLAHASDAAEGSE